MFKRVSKIAFFVFLACAGRSFAQVTLESQEVFDDAYFDNQSTATQGSFFVSLLFITLIAVGIASFLWFWKNRKLISNLFESSAEDSKASLQDVSQGNTASTNDNPYDHKDNETQKMKLNNKDDIKLEKNDTTIHIVDDFSENEYKRPRLTLKMEDGEPKLVFE